MQLECQSKCEAISTCPGISYSSKAGQSHCYVCKRDDLSSAANDYGFFRNGNYYGKFYTGTFIHVLYSTAIGNSNSWLLLFLSINFTESPSDGKTQPTVAPAITQGMYIN